MKLIFVTQRIDEAVSYAERRDALDQRWAVLLEKLGCAALPVPNHPKTAAALLERVRPDGILLTGGNDPASCGGNAPERDETERYLLQQALEQKIPVYGFCRGMQSILNFYDCELQEVTGHVAVKHIIDGTWGKREVVTISQGICWGIPRKGNRSWDFLHAADNMLYRVKKFSRNNYCVGGLDETEDVTMGTAL